AVYQLPGTNALDTMKSAKALMDDLKTRFPEDLDYTVSLDTTLAVSQGIKEIVTTLVEALILVVLVVFIFLQNWRSTLIPLLVVPVPLVLVRGFPFSLFLDQFSVAFWSRSGHWSGRG